LNSSRNNASNARVNLAQLMGIDPRTPVITADSSEPAIDANDVNALVNTALAQRSEMLQAQSNLQAASHGLNVAKTTDAPSLGASVGWLQRGSDFPPDRNTLTYGFSVEWTPFDAGLTRGRVNEARAELKQANAQLEAVRLAVVSDVSQTYLNLVTAEQGVVTAESEVANAQETLRLVDGRYQAGLGTFLDVLDAQSALVTAQTNLVNAKSAVDQARASMNHAIGRPVQVAAGSK